MGFDSMFTGISGLNTYQSWIDMISNNIANVDTTGFKGQRMTFADLFYQQQGAPSGPTQNSGGVNPQDLGLGVKVASVDTQFQQGGFQTTDIPTDLALNGDGFFILNNPGGGSPVYTRDGAFSVNQNGLMYDPSSGLAVQGYMANKAGQVGGALGNINIPLGLGMQATATGAGTKVGPAGDNVFDASIGGNLDQTQWSQQFLNQVGASTTAGQPYTISTTFYDSLGNAHPVQLTYTPDTTGAKAATAAVTGGNPANVAGLTVNPGTPANDAITVTVNAGGTAAVVSDGNTTINAVPGQQVQIGGSTITLAGALVGGSTTNVTVTGAINGLPTTVDNAQGQAVKPATRWQVSATFTDGTTFQAIKTAGTVGAGGVVTAPTLTAGGVTTGTIGYVYADQNGDFINSSTIEGTAPGQSIVGAAAQPYVHGAGSQPSVLNGNELNIISWGPGAGNNAQAPTGAGAPVTGPIGLDFSGIGSFGEANASSGSTNNTNYTVSFLSQNGYAEGTLDSIVVGQDGTITGSFTNGQQQTLARVAVATFENEDGLSRIGGNQFAQTSASGLAQVGTANSGRFGAIEAGQLEQSNVSLSTEFTNLILAQRAFEANTRGITTADQNLQTITHINASEN